MATVGIKGVGQIQEEERLESEAAEAALSAATKDNLLTNLSSTLDTFWEKAKRNKIDVEDRMLKNLRARNGEYESKKLAAMKAMFGGDYDPPFAPITETKCRAGEAWIKDTVFQPGERPFNLEPTPVPEVPEQMIEAIRAELMQELAMQVQQEIAMTGIVPDPGVMEQMVNELMPEIETAVNAKVKQKAREAAREMGDKIYDQFIEGGWGVEFEKAIFDVVTYGTMILKGPLDRKSVVRMPSIDPMTGMTSIGTEERITPEFERRSPLDIYPMPDTVDTKRGGMFDKINMTRMYLSELIGVEGWDEKAIREVLREHKSGGLREWTNIDSERIDLEGKDDMLLHETENIDCLEFSGSLPGSLLKEHGLDETSIPDEDLDYEVVVWKIGRWVIRAIINDDPYKRKHFYVAGYGESPDSFFHKGVPELVEHAEIVACQSLRAIQHNVALASGPQVEVNMDRVAAGENVSLYANKVWQTTSQGMLEGKAVNFYMPQIVVHRLMEVYEFCLKMADEDSGIPRYAHGETQVGGAGDTASGLSMLISQASRGIKSVIKNIDIGIIEPCVMRMFDYNMEHDPDPKIIGDVKAMATGASSLMAKEQQTIRRKEFLAETNNEVDMAIIGMEGRKAVLKENVKALDMDVDAILEASGGSPQQMMPPPVQEGAPGAAPVATDAAGNPVAGRDNQAFESPQGSTP